MNEGAGRVGALKLAQALRQAVLAPAFDTLRERGQ